MTKYFKYDNEYISGWQYFLRTIINSFLIIILIGLYLQSVNAYKRSQSLGNSNTTSVFFAIWGFLAIIIGIAPGGVFINIIPHWYLWFSNGNPAKIPINERKFSDNIEKESNKLDIDKKAKIIFENFESELYSKNLDDYPVPYWYEIIKKRSDMMKLDSSKKDIIEIQNEWTFMHADEYKTKYKTVSKKESIHAISIRIERYGFIYEKLCKLEKQLNDLIKDQNVNKSPFKDTLNWDKASAASSLFGSINFALSIGMSNDEISNLYKDFVYDESTINGTDPYASYGVSKSEGHKIIKEKLGIDMDDVKVKQVNIKKRMPSALSNLNVQERYAIFTVLLLIANSDGITDDENIVLNDIRLELEIDSTEYEKAKMGGNQACDLLINLAKEEKEALSRYIVLVVGADGKFTSKEMLWVNDVIRELDLDNNIIIELTDKYWNKLNTNKSNEKNDDTSEKINMEISHDEMNKLNDEEIFRTKNGDPFTGILYTNPKDDQGKIECSYVDGKKHGEYIEYDNEDNNKIVRNKFYKYGKLDGPDTYWWEKYSDDKNISQTNYSSDPNIGKELGSMMDKMIKKHDVMRETNYKGGLLHGKFYDCNWNGGVNFEMHFKNGKKDGVWNQYFETPLGSGQGALKKVSIFRDDIHVSSIYYNISGEEIEKEDALNDHEWGNEVWNENSTF